MSATDDLARRLAPICESAVSPLEIASALEFDGFTDRAVRDAYGADDVFALARDLYDRVPRRPAAVQPDDDPWLAGRFRPLLHGVLYALPAVAFPAAHALFGGPGVIPVLIIALLTGWGLSQGLAAVGYRRLGAGGPVQTGRVLRAGLLFGLAAAGAVLSVTALMTGSRPSAAAFGAGEDAYMLAAAVLLVTGAERWLLAALAPAVAGSVVYLGLGQPPRLAHLAWAALAASPLLACVLALSPRGSRGHPVIGYGGPGLAAPSRAELSAALPAVAFAALAGGLLVVPVAAGPDGAGGVNVGALSASVPLALSMGAAEWCLLRYRRRGQRLLRAGGDLRSFAGRARLALLAALGQYAGVMVVLVAAAVDVAVGTGQAAAGWQVFAAAGGYALLGTAMFCALLLQSALIRAVPLLACAVALVVEYVLRAHGLAVQIAVPGALTAVMIAYALARAGDATTHA